MSLYLKAIATLVISILAAFVAGIGNGELGDLDTGGWVKVALVVLGGTGFTWFAENVTGVLGGAIKAFLGAATAGLTAWTVAYENDLVVSQGERLTIVIAVITALTAVYQLRNTRTPA